MRKADNLPPYCAAVKKSGSLNFLEASGPAQACYGRPLPLPLPRKTVCIPHYQNETLSSVINSFILVISIKMVSYTEPQSLPQTLYRLAITGK